MMLCHNLNYLLSCFRGHEQSGEILVFMMKENYEG